MVAVRLVDHQIYLHQLITEKSVENALRVLMAVGGSTNRRPLSPEPLLRTGCRKT